ncbi:MAG: glycosyltransferase [Actinobacteria bacterium]|nr:glycosyltransferase [Actinomycetota bacterium]
MKRVTVVLVHWNQPLRCVRSIEAFLAQDVPVELVVVDNGSEAALLDRLQDEIRAREWTVRVLPQGHNSGFGPAANAGFRWWLGHGDGDWVALAPHDALPEPGTLATLVAAAEAQPHAGLACADVGDGETPVVDPYFGGMTKPAEVGEGWEPADYPHGTLLIARRQCLVDIGLFDERFFAYCEEADLGLRAKKAGWEVGLVRGARVHNPTMRSGSPAVDYLMHRNTLLLVREHSGSYHAFIRFNIAGWQLLRGMAQPSSRAWLFSSTGRALGMLDFLRGRYGPPPSLLLASADLGDAPALDARHDRADAEQVPS